MSPPICDFDLMASAGGSSDQSCRQVLGTTEDCGICRYFRAHVLDPESSTDEAKLQYYRAYRKSREIKSKVREVTSKLREETSKLREKTSKLGTERKRDSIARWTSSLSASGEDRDKDPESPGMSEERTTLNS